MLYPARGKRITVDQSKVLIFFIVLFFFCGGGGGGGGGPPGISCHSFFLYFFVVVFQSLLISSQYSDYVCDSIKHTIMKKSPFLYFCCFYLT